MSNITINYVWLGSNPLGPLEKFNIASWRAFGHEVNLYTTPFFGDPKRTYDSPPRRYDLFDGRTSCECVWCCGSQCQ